MSRRLSPSLEYVARRWCGHSHATMSLWNCELFRRPRSQLETQLVEILYLVAIRLVKELAAQKEFTYDLPVPGPPCKAMGLLLRSFQPMPPRSFLVMASALTRAQTVSRKEIYCVAVIDH